MVAPTLPELLVPDAEAWRAWLADHHADSPGVWLVLHKRGGHVTALTYAAALDEALCFGWIDGQARSCDERELDAADDAARSPQQVVGPQRRARRSAGGGRPDARERPGGGRGGPR